MPRRTYTKNGTRCRVTFELPAGVQGASAVVCGDFNDWSPAADVMAKRKDGRLSVTVLLASGRSYRYRFLVDGHRWENDGAADAYVENDFGGEDCLLQL